MVASLVAALIPSYDATRTPPAGSLRRSDVEESALRLLKPVTIIALALNVVGALLLIIPSHSLIISFVSLFRVVVGGALLTPVVLVAAMRLLTPLTKRIFGVLGRMAPREVSRALSRTAVAVAALTVAVSVIVGVSVMIDSFRATIGDWLDTTLGADIYVSPRSSPARAPPPTLIPQSPSASRASAAWIMSSGVATSTWSRRITPTCRPSISTSAAAKSRAATAVLSGTPPDRIIFA
jgi:putative ABC transport system permease protein